MCLIAVRIVAAAFALFVLQTMTFAQDNCPDPIPGKPTGKQVVLCLMELQKLRNADRGIILDLQKKIETPGPATHTLKIDGFELFTVRSGLTSCTRSYDSGVSVFCPSGTIRLSGGCSYACEGVGRQRSEPIDQGWKCAAEATGSASYSYRAYAVCLKPQ